jgi:hypothetical protein
VPFFLPIIIMGEDRQHLFLLTCKLMLLLGGYASNSIHALSRVGQNKCPDFN